MIHLGCRAFVIEEEILWFSNVKFNGLYKVDLLNGKIEWVHKFKNISYGNTWTHSKMYKEGEELIFIPLFDDKITIYNLKTAREEIIKLPLKNNKTNFTGCSYKSGNKIWLVSNTNVEDIFCYDIKLKNIEKEENLSKVLSKYLGDEEFFARGNVCGDRIIIFESEKNKVCEINMATKEVQSFEIKIEGANIIRVGFDGENYWCVQFDSHDVYEWNKENDTYVKYISEDKEFLDYLKKVPYSEFLFMNGEVVLNSHSSKGVNIVDKEKRTIKKLFDLPKFVKAVESGKNNPLYSGIVHYANKIYLIPERASHLLIYELGTQNIREIELMVCREDLQYSDEILRELTKASTLIESSEIYTLENYIKSLRTMRKK